MMNPELKKKWVDALRSGKYEQGQGVLVNQRDQFCCLGVLCAVKGLTRSGPHETYIVSDGMRLLPDALKAEMPPETENILAHKNDNGVSFSEIATYIEENL